MDLSKVNNGRSDCIFKIEEVEKKRNSKYVGEFCLLTKSGEWANSPASIFYQEKPPVEGYSNYFALIVQNGTLYITSGASAVEETIWAVQADDGEIIYSRYRHDYRESKDKSVFIDGGRDYLKSSTQNVIPLEIVDGKFALKDLTLTENIKQIKNSKLKG